MKTAKSMLLFGTILLMLCAGTYGFAQNQFAPEEVILESDFTRPDEILAADFNNDGFEDLLVYSPFDDKMSWIPNYGGEFGEPIFIQNDVWHYNSRKSFAVADLDGNGTQDIVFVTKDDHFLAWCSNWTDGIFGPPQIIDSEFSSEIDQIEIRNLDGFSKPVIYTIEGNIIAHYTFNNEMEASKEILASTNSTWGTYAIADLFNDSTPELIYRGVYPYDHFQISYVNPEDPSSYLKNTTYTTDDLRIQGIETADINGDGHTDILLYCRDSNYDYSLLIAENNGLGGFEQRISNCQIVSSNSAELADVDLDGDLDIVDGTLTIKETGSELLNWIENDGNGNFTNFQTWNENSADYSSRYDWVSTDINNDGILEYIFAWEESNAIKLFEKEELYYFKKELTYSVVKPRVFKVTDFDVNGLEDILFVARNNDGLEVLLQTSIGEYSEPISICTNMKNIVGIYAYAGDETKYWIRTSDGFYIVSLPDLTNFECSSRLLQEDQPVYLVSFSDLNGDGFEDLTYYRGNDDNLLRTFINDNDESLEESSSIVANANNLYSWYPPLYAHIDIDNNGLNEITLVDIELTQIHIRERKGNGEYSLEQSIDLPICYNTGRIFVRDLNNDGHSDMLFITELQSDFLVNAQRSYWFLNRGDGSFHQASFIRNLDIDENVMVWYLLDIDNDTDLDLIVKKSGDLGFSWCENDGNGNFDFIAPIDGATVRSIHKFNSDVQGKGTPEYFGNSGTNLCWLKYSDNCEGRNLEAINIESNNQYYGDSGDLDADGDQDLVASNEKIVWYKNVPSLPFVDFEITGPCGSYCFVNQSAADFSNSTIEWDFGDGETSSDISPDKSNFDLGTYQVTLTICNDYGCDSKTQELNVEHFINFDLPESALVNTPIQFQDAALGFTNFSWVFGDGEVSTERNPVHTYSEPGTYTIEVYLTDNAELDCTHSYTKQIQVLNENQFSNSENLVITPNPSTTSSIVELSAFGDITKLNIYNAQGDRVFQIETSDTVLELDASSLSPGVYYVVVEGSNETFARTKWVVF